MESLGFFPLLSRFTRPGQPFQVLDAFNSIGLEVQHLEGEVELLLLS